MRGGSSHLLKACHVLSKLVLTASMQKYHYLHLLGEKTEAQKPISLAKVREQETDGG